jgi:hypothetical protein
VFGPLFNTQDGVFTFASIVTKQDRSGSAVPTHWIYLYKDLTNLTANCQHSDGNGSQTVNDLGTFFLGNNLAPGGTVFPDVDSTSTGFYIAPGFTGMFTVSNYLNGGSSTSESSIAGEVLIADLNTGNVLSYRMIIDPRETDEAKFDDIAYGAFASQVVVDTSVPAAPLAIWHRQQALEANWFVMAPRDDMVDPTVPDLTLTISFAGNRPTSPLSPLAPDVGSYRVGFYYDRNENLISTSKRVTFQCIARLGPADFIDAGNLPSAANTGGWAHVEIVAKPPEGDGVHRDIGLLLYKLESAGADSVWTSENRIDF